MKRLSILLLTVLYTSVSLGIDLNLHYCGGKLATVKLANPVSSCCCDAQGAMNDCCNDTQLTVQMDVDQAVGHTASLNHAEVQPLAIVEWNAQEIVFESEKRIVQHQALPPPKASDRRVTLGSLTFYG